MKRLGIKDVPGCYACFDPGGSCLYVGKSNKLLYRIHRHYIDERDGRRAQWRLTGLSEWYLKRPSAPPGAVLKVWPCPDYHEFEKGLILEFDPVYNRKRYEDGGT